MYPYDPPLWQKDDHNITFICTNVLVYTVSCMYPSSLFIVIESFSLNLRKLECSQIKLWWLHESKEQNGQTCITNWSK